MATGWRARPGRFVRYRTAANVMRRACIKTVTSQTVLTLRLGSSSNGSDVVAVTKGTRGRPSTAAWFPPGAGPGR